MKILSPVGEVDTRSSIGLAPRRKSLTGGVIGLLSNGKPNAYTLLETAFRQLQGRLGPFEAVRYEKHVIAAGSGSASPPWLLDKLASGMVAVIAGSGD